jgi:hypothetical protein
MERTAMLTNIDKSHVPFRKYKIDRRAKDPWTCRRGRSKHSLMTGHMIILLVRSAFLFFHFFKFHAIFCSMVFEKSTVRDRGFLGNI